MDISGMKFGCLVKKILQKTYSKNKDYGYQEGVDRQTQQEAGPHLNTLRLRQNGRHFADDTFKRIFLNENVRISIKISLKFLPKGPINNNPALVQIMAWRRSGNKPLSEPMMVSLLTHICFSRPQWVNMKTVFPGMGIAMLKIRRSWDRLIFNMGIPILVRQHLYIETSPRWWQ